MKFYEQYKWLVPSLSFSILLMLVRVIFSAHITFIFMAWNLFLAVLPLYFAYKVDSNTQNKLMQYTFISLWLLFFPNSMYIVTDLFHLAEREDMPLWYDLLLLLSAGINGVVLGFASLMLIEKWLHKTINTRYVKLVVFALLLLCGYGIYLGRYLRWNSWDIIWSPHGLFSDIAYNVIHPFRNIDVWLLTALFGVWLQLLYGYIKRLTGVRIDGNG